MALRRTLALLLVPLVVLAFLVALVAGRVDATLLDPGFLERHVEDARLYALVREEGVPAFVDDYLERQDERLPEHLRGADLPVDAAARARITDLAQVLLDEQVLRDLVRTAADGLRYAVGRSDGFEVTADLHAPLVAVFDRDGTRPSRFEQAWTDLEMGERMMRGFTEHAFEANEAGDAAVSSTQSGSTPSDSTPGAGVAGDAPRNAVVSSDSAALETLIAADEAGVARWWDGQFLGIVDGLAEYLSGESDDLRMHIDFASYPQMAVVLAEPLRTDPFTLQRDGWSFTEEDLVAKLAESQDVAPEDVEEWFQVFRPGGATFDGKALVRWQEGRSPGGEDASFEERRDVLGLLWIAATWGAAVLAAVLVVGVGFLGARTWPGRLAWGSAGLLAASAVALLLTVPVYAALGSGRVEARLDDLRGDTESRVPGVIRERVADMTLDMVRDMVGGMQWRAAAWSLLALLGLAFALLWRTGRFGGPFAPRTTEDEHPIEVAPDAPSVRSATAPASPPSLPWR